MPNGSRTGQRQQEVDDQEDEQLWTQSDDSRQQISKAVEVLHLAAGDAQGDVGGQETADQGD